MGDEDDIGWSKTVAEVDQTIAALRGSEYEILRFRDATKDFSQCLKDNGLNPIQIANIVHGMALAALFPEYT